MIHAVRVADLLPEDLAKEKTVLEAAALVSRVYDFHRHPYFLWMQAPSTTLEEFRRSQEPYRHYVEHFSQALTAVLARMYPMKQRLSTVFENVVEEHGEGHMHKSHRETFNGYLRAIGCSDGQLTSSPPPRIAAAYEALLNFCLVNPAEMGAAAVGIVEYTHIKVAGMLSENMHDRFWGDVDAQHHYRFHEELDVEHAADLFAVCEEPWQVDSMRHRMSYAMLLGAHWWWTLFDQMAPAEVLSVAETDAVRTLFKRGQTESSPPAAPHARRKSPRLPVDLRAVVRDAKGQDHVTRVTSLSPSGLAIADPENNLGVRLDVMLGIDVAFPSRAETVSVRGRVRTLPGSASPGIGIEFAFENEDQRDLVARLVGDMRRQRRSRPPES